MHFQLNKITLSIILGYSTLAPHVAFASSLSSQTFLSYDYSLNGLGISQSGTGPVNITEGYPNGITGYGVLPSVSVFNNGTDMGVQAVAGGNTSGWDIMTFSPTADIPFSNSSASTTFHATYTNTGAQTDNYSFNFNIDKGFLQAFPFTAGETASFSGKILVNGILAWSSSASVTLDSSSVASFTSSGTDLNYALDSSNFYQSTYTFGGYHGIVDLGALNPNESVDVEYVLSTSSITQGFYWYGGAIASVNDPFGPSSGSTQPSIFVSPTVPVPEPDTLAMMAVGAGLLASRIKNRKKKS